MNAVLRSITQTIYNDKCNNNITTCKVLQFNTAYGMVKQTIHFIDKDPLSNQDQVVEFQVTKPMMSNTTLLMSNMINPDFWKNPRFCPEFFYFLKPELFE